MFLPALSGSSCIARSKTCIADCRRALFVSSASWVRQRAMRRSAKPRLSHAPVVRGLVRCCSRTRASTLGVEAERFVGRTAPSSYIPPKNRPAKSAMLWLTWPLDCASACQRSTSLISPGIFSRNCFSASVTVVPYFRKSSWRSLLFDLDQFGLRSFPSTQINFFTLGVYGMSAMHPIPFGQRRSLVQVFHNLSPTTPVVCTESDFSFLGCHGGL